LQPKKLGAKTLLGKELQTHNKFKQAREAVKALTEEQIEQYKVDFENHLKAPNPKYSYLSGYIFAQEYKKLNN
jgi:predicted transcriptional regulator YdeE